MMGKTHRAGGALAMLLSYQFMQNHDMLAETINPVVQLLIMYPCCMWGSVAPDLDQSDDAIPEKAPLSILIHKIIYLGKVRHRSWQTHSIAFTGGLVGLLFLILLYINNYGLLNLNAVSLTILKLMLMGLSVGIASHLLLDAFTYEGIHLIPPTKGKNGKKKVHWIRFVPHTDAFKTNTKYETVVRYLLYILFFADLIYIIYQIVRNII